MKKDSWTVTLRMNSLHVTKVDIKLGGVKVTAVNTPVPHGQPFTVPICTKDGEVHLLLEVSRHYKGKHEILF